MQISQGDLACRGLEEGGSPFFEPLVIDLHPRSNRVFFKGNEVLLVGKGVIHLSRRRGFSIHEVDFGIQLKVPGLYIFELGIQRIGVSAWGRVSDVFLELGNEGCELIKL